jgi:transposase
VQKKYIVRLSDAERKMLAEVVRKLKGSSMKVRRANVLLKADAGGPAWTDDRIAEAYGCTRKAVEKIRERLVTEGFEATLAGKPHARRPRKLTGDQEAKIIAARLSGPPPGFAAWTLRLLAERVVALEIVDAISHETVRRTLKKTASRPARRSTG